MMYDLSFLCVFRSFALLKMTLVLSFLIYHFSFPYLSFPCVSEILRFAQDDKGKENERSFALLGMTGGRRMTLSEDVTRKFKDL